MGKDSRNFLLPSYVTEQSEEQLYSEAVALADLLAEMGNNTSSRKVVILDGCNEAEEVTNLLPNTTLIFAASPGQPALDIIGNDSYGPFTGALIDTLRKQQQQQQQVSLSDTFGVVADLVSTRSQGRQIPWMTTTDSGAFSFFPHN